MIPSNLEFRNVLISASGSYVSSNGTPIVTETNVEALKEVRMTYSGRLATRNRIETFNWVAAAAMAWRIHFCGFGSVHSSKPSIMMSFGAKRRGTKLRGSTMRARIWASREREKIVGSYSSGDEFADFRDCEIYQVHKGRYNRLNVISLGDCSRKGPARNDYPSPLAHLSNGLRDG
jgi:hypothetical protein